MSNRAENSRGFGDGVGRLADLKTQFFKGQGADASPLLNGSHAQGTNRRSDADFS